MNRMKLLLMGFGNAGKAYARLLLRRRQQIAEQYGYEIVVAGIVTATKGNLWDDNGLDLEMVLKHLEGNAGFCNSWSSFCSLTGQEIIETMNFDTLVEMSPLNIQTGQPAINHIKAALGRGIHVITANKGPVAWEFQKLKRIAMQNGVGFLYETTVMDGTPVFNLYHETLPMCTVTEIKGILNSTTNFILIEMAKGQSFAQAVEEGKRRGFVEADPSMDIEGYDAAAKTAALLNVLMDADIKPTEIEREGIGNVTHEMLQEAASSNKVMKLVCRGWRENGCIKGEVKLKAIDSHDLLARVDGTTSILSITTDLMGKISVVEHEPEIEQTGYGIFSDTLRLLKWMKQ